MALFSININEKTQKDLIQEDNNCIFQNIVESQCQTTAEFTVEVPIEESRRVVVIGNDAFGSPVFDTTITTTTTFNVSMSGEITNQNVFLSELMVQIYLEPPSPVMIGFCSLFRTHSGNLC